jgi:hypothetical protein
MIIAIMVRIRRFLFYRGYFRLEDITTRGHCGYCGAPIESPLPADWPWGMCDKCRTESEIRFIGWEG